jgi:hypothetical protein
VQRIANIEKCLNVLKGHGICLKGNGAEDLANGSRDQTLALLWLIIFRFRLSFLLKRQSLVNEISKRVMSFEKTVAETPCLFANDEFQLLFVWARVCAGSGGIVVENLTTDFQDGRAFLAILRTYFPHMVCQEDIKSPSGLHLPTEDISLTQSRFEETKKWAFTFGKTKEAFESFSNEKSNFKLLMEKVSALGGIPAIGIVFFPVTS